LFIFLFDEDVAVLGYTGEKVISQIGSGLRENDMVK
jgi:hypothetical protein